MGRDKVTIFNKNQEVENWERRKSQEICSKILERRGAQIDGLFCCNDDIALGARNAILIAKKTGIIRPEKKIRIVGFDCIDEARDLIDNEDEYMLASVDVDIEGQIKLLMDVIEKIIDKHEVPERQFVEPTVYHQYILP
jgi:ABC-type sugar transport system substrate-binding protein